MDLVDEQIKTELIKLASSYGPAMVMPVKVTAINNDDTVSVEFGDGSTVDDVRLKAVVKSGNKFILVPKVGSTVQVASLEGSSEYVVIATDEITDVKLKVDNVTMELRAEGLFFENGTDKFHIDGGFLIEKNGDSLKKVLDDLFTAIKAITVPTNVGPSGTPINFAVFEAIKVRAGNLLK